VAKATDDDDAAPVWIDISIADARTMIRVGQKAYEIVVAAWSPGRHS
jgi:hypothetical protein